MLFICNVDSELELKSFELRPFINSQHFASKLLETLGSGKDIRVVCAGCCGIWKRVFFAFRRPDCIASLKEVLSSWVIPIFSQLAQTLTAEATTDGCAGYAKYATSSYSQ